MLSWRGVRPASRVAEQAIQNKFNPARTVQGRSTSLSFTLTNPAGNLLALTGVGFTDTLDRVVVERVGIPSRFREVGLSHGLVACSILSSRPLATCEKYSVTGPGMCRFRSTRCADVANDLSRRTRDGHRLHIEVFMGPTVDGYAD